jgi:hypothetical protein
MLLPVIAGGGGPEDGNPMYQKYKIWKSYMIISIFLYI